VLDEPERAVDRRYAMSGPAAVAKAAEMREARARDVDAHATMEEGWQFNAAVASSFEDMLERSIPAYATMRDIVGQLGRRFARRGTHVVDLGSSRGEGISLLLDHFGGLLHYDCVEVSQPMRDAFAERYGTWLQNGVVELHDMDLRHRFPFRGIEPGARPAAMASLVQAVLTLMFIPINYRQRLLRDCFEALLPGGALVLVEKVLGEGAELDQWMTASYHEMKRGHGYSQDEVTRKALALEGVQVPVTASWNVELLRRAGFTEVDCAWRHFNFGCWVALKG
jgi:tRNA (cmo5U34)-methyltransferase